MEDNQPTTEVNKQTLEDNQKIMEDKQQTLEDYQQTMEYNKQTMEDNLQTLEGKQKTMEADHQIMEDDQQIMDYDQQTMEDDQQTKDSTNLSKHQKQRSNLVKKWKEIEREQIKIINVQKMDLELDENKPGIRNLTQDIIMEEVFNLKSESRNEVDKYIASKDELFTKKQMPQCVECGKLFSRSDKLNSHMKLVHTYEPCTCPFCGTKTLKNKSYLAKHISKEHKDFKIRKEEINLFNEEEKIKINNVLLNETVEMQKPLVEMQNISQDSGRNECNKCGKLFSQIGNLNDHIKTEHTFEPRSCPLCEGTILKNQTYLIKHLKQFHKNYKLPEENITNVYEEVEIKLNQDIIDGFVNSWQNEWNARIDAKNNSEEMQDLKLEAIIPEIELSEKNNLEEMKDLKLEASNEVVRSEIDMYEIKTEGDEDIDEEILKRENKDDTGDDISNSKIKLEKSFICDLCGKVFEKDCLLKRHIWVHADVKPFCCNDCPKTFTSQGAVNYHKMSHTNERPFMCDICSQSFKTKWPFEQHKLIHTGEKPFQCVDCGQTFRLKDFMNVHKKKFHTNEKPFVCDICSQTFVTKTKFEQHKLIHTGEKPHQCDECEASFRLKYVLKNHKKKIHIPEVNRLCPLCGKSFKKKRALGGHMATAHPSEKQSRNCSVCDQEFKNASSLKQHQKKHTEEGDIECVCSECGQTCKSQREMKIHIRAEHRRKNNIVSFQADPDPSGVFKCSECNKQFGRRRSLYNHNYYTHMIQNVACPSCGKTCKNKVALSRHIKRSCLSAFNSNFIHG